MWLCFQVADVLQMSQLKQDVLPLIIDSINDETAAQILHFATAFFLRELEQKAFACLLLHPRQVSESPFFVQLDVDVICKVILPLIFAFGHLLLVSCIVVVVVVLFLRSSPFWGFVFCLR